MKKTTKKAPAPAAVPDKKIVAPAKKTAAPVKKIASPAKRKSTVNSEPPATFVTAKIDIGFGNHLFIRGEGPGLSWDHGTAMDCVGAGLWTIAIKEAATPVIFKVLVNDLSWSAGADFVAIPGQSLTINPTF
jgi:hypothetical protein